MVNLIRPSKVIVSTKDGECTIHLTLDLNININSSGEVSVGKQDKEEILKEEEETAWVIPSFKSIEKIQFGNKDKTKEN